ncbi:site-specific DNA-methyltransferase [Roseivirga sp. UBA1976]|uniref:DNA methyltransferase n=1 Tax=Roseivirga sp. UBA1976 TaxID=1947386 RepID=UPI0025811724|nr:site-specific DNA-methyltransferase [Roseivirga sp. UBA1976]|tara:strand:+ start:2437 stop:4314 length:1878 start_codon:yes stop_codon:yes gene_type:complete
MQLFEHVKEVLSKNESFCKDGKLFKNNVVEAALKLDAELLTILLKDDTTKKHFFTTVPDRTKGGEGVQVFDKVKFQQFVSNKQFLPDSYTAFKNKIGLTANGEYLTEANEVVLDFPYKDCVLEGGQTKEDQKRKEIFWNETLASDEIDRLFEPKVLNNWKKYDKKGEHVPTTVSNKDNLMIKGNNLLALHSLKTVYKGEVKLIYIDPPYNTGGDGFGYNDRFNHASWLVFVKNRLEVAKELLTHDGSIWINIDDDESHYLKVLCDSVFGRENFLANVIWQKKYAASNDTKGIADFHDHILVYQRSDRFERNLLPRTEKQNKLYKYDDNDGKGRWRSDNLLVRSFSEDYVFPITNPNTKKEYLPKQGSCWRANKETIEKWLEENRIFFGKDGKGAPQLKRYLNEVQQGIVPGSIWLFDEVGHNDNAKKEIEAIFGTKAFMTPKPERLLERIIHIATKEGDIVLDFFAGSGTTAAVAHKMKRQFITIEQMDYVESVTKLRLKKVIEGEQGGISEKVNWKGGGSFVYAELAENAASYISKIETLKSTKEAIALWNELKEEPFISYRVSPSEFDANIDSFEQLELDDQKKLLISTIDKNHLYINYADIEDKTYNISEEEKRLNRDFYKM